MKYVVGLGLAIVIIAGTMVAVGFYLSPQTPLRPVDAIVVISGGETDQRVAEGVKLFQQNYAPLMIMSGAARDENISNAEAMRRLAVELGVPSEVIILEQEARNTLDNAEYVRELLNQYHVASIILVTSPYHQRRAYISFRYFLGPKFPILNHSATDSAWRKNGWWLSPWARHLTLAELSKILYLPVIFREPEGEGILGESNLT